MSSVLRLVIAHRGNVVHVVREKLEPRHDAIRDRRVDFAIKSGVPLLEPHRERLDLLRGRQVGHDLLPAPGFDRRFRRPILAVESPASRREDRGGSDQQQRHGGEDRQGMPRHEPADRSRRSGNRGFARPALRRFRRPDGRRDADARLQGAVLFQVRLTPFQEVGDFDRRGVPIGGVFGVEFRNDRAKPFRNLRDDLADRSGRVFRQAFQDGEQGRGSKRRPAAARGVEHAPEAEEVGPLVDRPEEGLLGGHVHRRPGDQTRLREGGVVDQAGQTKVGDLDPPRPFLQHDVAWLDVAVNEPRRVGSGQAVGDLLADAKHVRQVERPGLVELLLQGSAGNALHDEVRDVCVFDGVDRDDVLVANGRGRSRLAEEPLARGRGHGQARLQDLDGDDPAQPLVEHFQDDTEAPLPEHLQHLVMPQPAEHAGGLRRLQEAEVELLIDAILLSLAAGCARGRGCREEPGRVGRARVRALAPTRAPRRELLEDRLVENRTPTLMGVDEDMESVTEYLVTATGFIEVDAPFGGIGLRQGGVEDVAFADRRAPSTEDHGAFFHTSMRDSATDRAGGL
jgi:hypothetical protein